MVAPADLWPAFAGPLLHSGERMMIRLLIAALLLFGAAAPALACQWGRSTWAEPQRRAAASHAGDAAEQSAVPPATYQKHS